MTRRSIRSIIRSGLHVSLFSVDQAISSLSNLAASIIAAHALSPNEFGAFGIVFATFMLVIFAVRAITGEVLLLVGVERARADTATNLVIAAATGLVAGAFILCGGLLIGGVTKAGLVPLAIAMSGLAVQDAIRYVGFATKRVKIALTADILWLAFMLLGCLLFLSGGVGLGRVTSIWAASGVGAAVCTLPLLAATMPSRSSIGGWLRDQKRVMLSLFVDRGILSAMQQGVTYIIAIFVGLEGNAAYRGAQIVMGPINVFAMGLVTAMIPYFVNVWRQRPEALARESIRIATFGGICLLIVTQLAAGIPDVLGRALIGRSWEVSEPILRIMAFIIPLQIVNFTATGALRAMMRVGIALLVRIIITPLTLLAIISAAYFGYIGTVIWAQVGCTALSSLLWWTMFMRTHRRRLAEAEACA